MTAECFDPRYKQVEDNYKYITERIAEAAVRSGRRAEDVTFLAATKTVSPELINHAIGCGLRFIGENRVQELMGKYDALQRDGVSVQMIGRLQTNKVKYIIDKVDMIQSVDSLRLAQEISRQAEKKHKRMPILVEVNIGEEESKGGIPAQQLQSFLEEITVLPGLELRGLMTIPPICTNSRELCNYFSRMHQYFVDIKDKKMDNSNIECLSMGMSSDYEEAILCGATMVRVGSSLFGQRSYT